MKVLFVSSCYPSRDRTNYCVYLEEQALALIDNGVKCDVLVPNIVSNKEVACEEVILHGVFVRYWNIPMPILKEKLLFNIKENVISAFPWNEYDVVSIHILSNPLWKSIVKVVKRYHIPIIKHVHGLNVWHNLDTIKGLRALYYQWIKYEEFKIIKQSDALVGVSELVCSTIKEKVSNIPVYKVYNGVNKELFKYKEKRENEKFVILCVANLIALKGQEYLLRAVKLLKQDRINVYVKVIGIGNDELFLKKLCKEIGIDENVEFLGEKTHEEVASYMKEADMFILPSFYEALGCVYLEAMSCGLITCGCYENNGIAEVIKNKENGLLVRKRNEEDIANAIRFVMDNPIESKQIALEGKKTSENYSWVESAKKLKTVYKKVLVRNQEAIKIYEKENRD